MADHNWKVGQTVYVVPGRNFDPYTAPIVKIGREWGTIDHGWRQVRFSLRTGRLDNDRAQPGRVYATREQHETEVARAKAWNELWRLMERQYSAPSTVTLGAIETARELLFGARVKEASDG